MIYLYKYISYVSNLKKYIFLYFKTKLKNLDNLKI